MAPEATATKERKPRPAKASLPVDPLSTVSHFVHGGLAASIGTEHQRQVRLLIGESADMTDAAKRKRAIALLAEVTDADSYARVGKLLVDVGTRKKEIQAFFKPIKDLGYKLHKMICSRENEVLAPLELFEEVGARNYVGYEREQQRLTREREAQEAEAARQQEQQHLLQEADNLAARGDTQLAEAVREQAETLPAPVITLDDNLPAVQGITVVERWTWRPLGGDTPENRARMRQLLPRDYMVEDEKKLAAAAKHKGSLRIPGVEFYDAGGVTRR